MAAETTAFTGPCLCGKGKITTTVSEPEHPWAGARGRTRSHGFECIKCTAEYQFVEGAIFRRTEYEQQLLAKARFDEVRKALSTSPLLADLQTKMAAHLEALKSAAARHRFLTENRLESIGIATFREHWKSAAVWSQKNVRPHNAQKCLAALCIDGGPLADHLEEIAALERAIPRAPIIKQYES